jgi:hypothetical protein
LQLGDGHSAEYQLVDIADTVSAVGRAQPLDGLQLPRIVLCESYDDAIHPAAFQAVRQSGNVAQDRNGLNGLVGNLGFGDEACRLHGKFGIGDQVFGKLVL